MVPDREEFLEHLCRKAGMEIDAWRKPGVKVSVYQVDKVE
jgi:AMMECR1 domain-containing protein